ncbi:hypothetical protein DFH11DRAFT_1744591 [Phellopilus nigrolimitatus]|nr:hypothetical protein DFH11DRAFT_1744591 [Phellopilus nigrolimitatus]
MMHPQSRSRNHRAWTIERIHSLSDGFAFRALRVESSVSGSSVENAETALLEKRQLPSRKGGKNMDSLDNLLSKTKAFSIPLVAVEVRGHKEPIGGGDMLRNGTTRGWFRKRVEYEGFAMLRSESPVHASSPSALCRSALQTSFINGIGTSLDLLDNLSKKWCLRRLLRCHCCTLANYTECSGPTIEYQTYEDAKTTVDPVTHGPPKPDGKIHFIRSGIANFTNASSTFTGILRVLKEYKASLIVHSVKFLPGASIAHSIPPSAPDSFPLGKVIGGAPSKRGSVDVISVSGARTQLGDEIARFPDGKRGLVSPRDSGLPRLRLLVGPRDALGCSDDLSLRWQPHPEGTKEALLPAYTFFEEAVKKYLDADVYTAATKFIEMALMRTADHGSAISGAMDTIANTCPGKGLSTGPASVALFTGSRGRLYALKYTRHRPPAFPSHGVIRAALAARLTHHVPRQPPQRQSTSWMRPPRRGRRAKAPLAPAAHDEAGGLKPPCLLRRTCALPLPPGFYDRDVLDVLALATLYGSACWRSPSYTSGRLSFSAQAPPSESRVAVSFLWIAVFTTLRGAGAETDARAAAAACNSPTLIPSRRPGCCSACKEAITQDTAFIKASKRTNEDAVDLLDMLLSKTRVLGIARLKLV